MIATKIVLSILISVLLMISIGRGSCWSLETIFILIHPFWCVDYIATLSHPWRRNRLVDRLCTTIVNRSVLQFSGGIELNSFLASFVHLHFAANSLAAGLSRAADFGTNAHILVHSRLPVADIEAGADVVAAVELAAVVFVRVTIASGKSVATELHCELDAYKSVYFVDGLVPMTSAVLRMVASVMSIQLALGVAVLHLVVDAIAHSTMASLDTIHADYCCHWPESAMGRFCVAQIEHKLAHYCLASV